MRIENKPRCAWPGREGQKADAQYIAYHDSEWGVPEFDDRALYEKLVLDGFQAGLSWITILRKRENFRAAFDGFEPQVIARYDTDDIERLMGNAGIVRNRAKIIAAIRGAQIWLEMMKGQGFAAYLWDFVDGEPIQNHFTRESEVPAQTPLSVKISKDLKSRGFNFCGPTIVYAFMQATGMVNDHVTGCFRHDECAALAARSKGKA